MSQKLETLLYNGKIFSPDKSCNAIGIADGKIVGLGQKKDFESCVGPHTRRVNLHGKTVLPGFNDSHVHLWSLANRRATIQLQTTKSIPQILALCKEKARVEPPGKWIRGVGFQEGNLREKRLPTKHDLDTVTTRHPILLVRTCGHIYVANSFALKLAGITRHTRDPQGGKIERDAHGEPNGILCENARDLIRKVLPSFPKKFLQKLLHQELQYQLSLGITSATEPRVDPDTAEAFKHLESNGQIPIRVNLLYARYHANGSKTPLPDAFRKKFLKLDTIKFFADGGLSGATAALGRDYRNRPKGARGILCFGDKQLLEEFRMVHRKGFRIATHAIGDVAIEQVLNSYEKVLHESPRINHRHRIEHFGLPSKDHIRRAATGQFVLVPQPLFIRDLGSSFEMYLPHKMYDRCYPIRDLLDAGCHVALSSDAPVVPDNNPFLGLQSSLERLTSNNNPISKRQKISLEEAIVGYTYGSAFADGEENIKGQILPGYAADLCVVNRDPFKCPIREISKIKVLQTFVDGKLMYEADF